MENPSCKNPVSITLDLNIVAEDQNGNKIKCKFDKESIARSLVKEVTCMQNKVKISELDYTLKVNEYQESDDEYESEEEESVYPSSTHLWDIYVDLRHYIDLLKDNCDLKTFKINELEKALEPQD